MRVRESNFELLRIIAIIMVLILHADFFSLDGPSAQDIRDNTLESAFRILVQCLCIGAVNIFVMISGWWGIKPSVRGLSNLLFQTFFYLVIVSLVMLGLGVDISFGDFFKDTFMLNSSNWFIKAYLILFLLSPALNSFTTSISKNKQIKILIGIGLFLTIYGWLFPKSTIWIDGGYSPILFIYIYLIADFLNKNHPSPLFGGIVHKISYLWVVGAILLIEILICIIPAVLGADTVYGYNFLIYVSPTTIIFSGIVICYFSTLKISSSFINRLAKSSFAVYLVFVHPKILPVYGQFFNELYQEFDFTIYWLLVVLIAISLYSIIAVVDSVRLFIWNIVSRRFFEVSK